MTPITQDRQSRHPSPPAMTSLLQQPPLRRAPSPNPVVNRAVGQDRHPVLPGSRSPVPARRGAFSSPSANEASANRVSFNGPDAGPRPKARDQDVGQNRNKGWRGAGPRLQWSPQRRRGFCLTHQKQNKSKTEKMACRLAELAVPSRCGALLSRPFPRHQKLCCLCYGWNFVAACSRNPYSSRITGVRQRPEGSTAYPFSASRRRQRATGTQQPG